MNGIKVRQFNATQYKSISNIHNLIFPDSPLFLKRLIYEDSCYMHTSYRMRRYVATDHSAKVVGFGEYKHSFFAYHSAKYLINIEVHPDWQQRWIGTMLHDRLFKDLQKIGAEIVRQDTLTTSSSGIGFTNKMGFIEKSRMVESRLNLREFDTTSISDMVEKMRAEGIEISDLASDFELDASAGEKLRDVEGSEDTNQVGRDNPMTMQDYKMIIIDNPVIIWEGSFVAKTKK